MPQPDIFKRTRDPLKIGYARTSTNRQDLTNQTVDLKSYGCDVIVKEQISGAKSDRPKFIEMLDALIAGDELVVWDSSRLSRENERDVMVLLWDLEKRGITVTTLQNDLSFGNEASDLVNLVMTWQNRLERDRTQSRIKAGLRRAKSQGVTLGRPKALAGRHKTLIALHQSGLSARQIAEEMGTSKSTVALTLKRLRDDGVL